MKDDKESWNGKGIFHLKKMKTGGPVFKNLPANSGDTGSTSSPGRFHMPRGNLSLRATVLKPTHSRAHAWQQERSVQ